MQVWVLGTSMYVLVVCMMQGEVDTMQKGQISRSTKNQPGYEFILLRTLLTVGIWNEVFEVLPFVVWLWVNIEGWMDAFSLRASHYMHFCELVIYRLGTYITSWVSVGWCLDRSLLSMMCVGSSPRIIAIPCVENGSKALDNCTGNAWRGSQFTPTTCWYWLVRFRTRINLCSMVW